MFALRRLRAPPGPEAAIEPGPSKGEAERAKHSQSASAQSVPAVDGKAFGPNRAPAPSPRACDTINAQGVAVSLRLMGQVADPAAGILLSQLLYWTRRTPDLALAEGWICKSADEVRRATGMSWKVQHRARQILVNSGWLEERKLSMPARLEFRLHLPALARLNGQDSDMQAKPMDWATLADRHNPALERLLGRCFLFHGVLTGELSLCAALLASRLEARPQRDESTQELNWYRLHRRDWTAQTGLSRAQWQSARRQLCRTGVLLERGHNFPRRVDLALDPVRMAALLALCIERAQAEARDRRAEQLDAVRARAFGLPDALGIDTAPANPKVGLERAKQAGQFGRCQRSTETASPVSPFPAHTDSPIQPALVAQSCTHLKDSRYPRTPTTPHALTRRAVSTPPAFGWGGGGLSTWGTPTIVFSQGALPPAVDVWRQTERAASALEPTQVTVPDRVNLGETGLPHSTQAFVTASTATNPSPSQVAKSALPSGTPALTPEALLHWPRAFQEAPSEIGLAMRYLAGLDPAVQQAILDEIVFTERHAKREVRNHLGLLRTLSTAARKGEFVPEGAHKVATLRAKRLAQEAAQAALAARPAAPPNSTADRSKVGVSEETRRRLDALTQTVRRRAVG